MTDDFDWEKDLDAFEAGGEKEFFDLDNSTEGRRVGVGKFILNLGASAHGLIRDVVDRQNGAFGELLDFGAEVGRTLFVESVKTGRNMVDETIGLVKSRASDIRTDIDNIKKNFAEGDIFQTGRRAGSSFNFHSILSDALSKDEETEDATDEGEESSSSELNELGSLTLEGAGMTARATYEGAAAISDTNTRNTNRLLKSNAKTSMAQSRLLARIASSAETSTKILHEGMSKLLRMTAKGLLMSEDAIKMQMMPETGKEEVLDDYFTSTDIINNGRVDVSRYTRLLQRNFRDRRENNPLSQISQMLSMSREMSGIGDASPTPLGGFFRNLLSMSLNSGTRQAMFSAERRMTNIPLRLMNYFQGLSMGNANGIVGSMIGDLLAPGNAYIGNDKLRKGAEIRSQWSRRNDAALTTVIPSLLSKILASVSGTGEIEYDYERGIFVKSKAMERAYELERTNLLTSTQNYGAMMATVGEQRQVMTENEKEREYYQGININLEDPKQLQDFRDDLRFLGREIANQSTTFVTNAQSFESAVATLGPGVVDRLNHGENTVRLLSVLFKRNNPIATEFKTWVTEAKNSLRVFEKNMVLNPATSSDRAERQAITKNLQMARTSPLISKRRLDAIVKQRTDYDNFEDLLAAPNAMNKLDLATAAIIRSYEEDYRQSLSYAMLETRGFEENLDVAGGQTAESVGSLVQAQMPKEGEKFKFSENWSDTNIALRTYALLLRGIPTMTIDQAARQPHIRRGIKELEAYASWLKGEEIREKVNAEKTAESLAELGEQNFFRARQYAGRDYFLFDFQKRISDYMKQSRVGRMMSRAFTTMNRVVENTVDSAELQEDEQESGFAGSIKGFYKRSKRSFKRASEIIMRNWGANAETLDIFFSKGRGSSRTENQQNGYDANLAQFLYNEYLPYSGDARITEIINRTVKKDGGAPNPDYTPYKMEEKDSFLKGVLDNELLDQVVRLFNEENDNFRNLYRKEEKPKAETVAKPTQEKKASNASIIAEEVVETSTKKEEKPLKSQEEVLNEIKDNNNILEKDSEADAIVEAKHEKAQEEIEEKSKEESKLKEKLKEKKEEFKGTVREKYEELKEQATETIETEEGEKKKILSFGKLKRELIKKYAPIDDEGRKLLLNVGSMDAVERKKLFDRYGPKVYKYMRDNKIDIEGLPNFSTEEAFEKAKYFKFLDTKEQKGVRKLFSRKKIEEIVKEYGPKDEEGRDALEYAREKGKENREKIKEKLQFAKSKVEENVYYKRFMATKAGQKLGAFSKLAKGSFINLAKNTLKVGISSIKVGSYNIVRTISRTISRANDIGNIIVWFDRVFGTLVTSGGQTRMKGAEDQLARDILINVGGLESREDQDRFLHDIGKEGLRVYDGLILLLNNEKNSDEDAAKVLKLLRDNRTHNILPTFQDIMNERIIKVCNRWLRMGMNVDFIFSPRDADPDSPELYNNFRHFIEEINDDNFVGKSLIPGLMRFILYLRNKRVVRGGILGVLGNIRKIGVKVGKLTMRALRGVVGFAGGLFGVRAARRTARTGTRRGGTILGRAKRMVFGGVLRRGVQGNREDRIFGASTILQGARGAAAAAVSPLSGVAQDIREEAAANRTMRSEFRKRQKEAKIAPELTDSERSTLRKGGTINNRRIDKILKDGSITARAELFHFLPNLIATEMINYSDKDILEEDPQYLLLLDTVIEKMELYANQGVREAREYDNQRILEDLLETDNVKRKRTLLKYAKLLAKFSGKASEKVHNSIFGMTRKERSINRGISSARRQVDRLEKKKQRAERRYSEIIRKNTIKNEKDEEFLQNVQKKTEGTFAENNTREYDRIERNIFKREREIEIAEGEINRTENRINAARNRGEEKEIELHDERNKKSKDLERYERKKEKRERKEEKAEEKSWRDKVVELLSKINGKNEEDDDFDEKTSGGKASSVLTAAAGGAVALGVGSRIARGTRSILGAAKKVAATTGKKALSGTKTVTRTLGSGIKNTLPKTMDGIKRLSKILIQFLGKIGLKIKNSAKLSASIIATLTKKAGTSVVKRLLTKIGAAILTGGSSIISFMIIDAAYWAARASRYFDLPPGVKPSIKMRTVASAVGALNGLCFGLLCPPHSGVANYLINQFMNESELEALGVAKQFNRERAKYLGVSEENLRKYEDVGFSSLWKGAKSYAKMLGFNDDVSKYKRWYDHIYKPAQEQMDELADEMNIVNVLSGNSEFYKNSIEIVKSLAENNQEELVNNPFDRNSVNNLENMEKEKTESFSSNGAIPELAKAPSLKEDDEEPVGIKNINKSNKTRSVNASMVNKEHREKINRETAKSVEIYGPQNNITADGVKTEYPINIDTSKISNGINSTNQLTMEMLQASQEQNALLRSMLEEARKANLFNQDNGTGMTL